MSKPRPVGAGARGAGARLGTQLGTLRNEGSTKLKTWMRVVLLGVLIVALGVPPGTLSSYARQQEGPVTPAPGQQPGAAPKQPTGQQQPAQAGKAQAQAPQVTIAVQSNVVNIDAVVTVLNGAPEIWMNRSNAQSGSDRNHWIILKLVGVKSNRDGLGTKVKITTSRGTQYNQATTAVGYNSSSDKRLHFGLGSAGVVDTMELTWPSGIKQVLKKVKADQVLTVTEGAP